MTMTIVITYLRWLFLSMSVALPALFAGQLEAQMGEFHWVEPGHSDLRVPHGGQNVEAFYRPGGMNMLNPHQQGNNRTELLVLVTPYINPPNPSGGINTPGIQSYQPNVQHGFGWNSLNPQSEPPGQRGDFGWHELNPQPEPPGRGEFGWHELNPQPEPPGFQGQFGWNSLNPQSEPPGVRYQWSGYSPQTTPGIGNDRQLANIDMQNAIQRQQQTMQMMSNIAKQMHESQMDIVRKIGH